MNIQNLVILRFRKPAVFFRRKILLQFRKGISMERKTSWFADIMTANVLWKPLVHIYSSICYSLEYVVCFRSISLMDGAF
jgi:hypothetical protein